MFHCGHYESQDVLCEIDDVDLVCVDPSIGYETRELWQRRLIHRDVTKTLVFANPGLRKVRLRQEYDLFLVRCQTIKDLLDVNAIEGWKDYCRTSVCWIDELWLASLPELKYWLHALARFDHVFTSCSGTVAALADILGRPCYWLPGAVDALRFTPYPFPPTRVIDVYSIGRRCEGIHQRLLQAAKHREMFYVYDTSKGSLADVLDHRQHRDHLANMTMRSRYFVVAPGKVDVPTETQGQVEVGHRYCEGAAAGAVMIGQTPKCKAFHHMFPWPDAVIEIQPDGSDTLDVLDKLGSQPEHVSALSRRNTIEALRRHDWVYRWREIFGVSGLVLSPQMLARESLLQELATTIENQAT
ncbi:MAG: glycosyltransferase [Bryobacterales bacterium]|nr:glycosyltransferase [Bryobacterales bacterium]